MNLVLIADNIFFSYFLERLEALGLRSNNEILSLSRSNGNTYKFLDANVSYCDPREIAESEFGINMKKYEKIIIFTMGSSFSTWVSQIPKGIQVYWMIIGGGYYALAKTLHKTIAPKTRMFFDDLGMLKESKAIFSQINYDAVQRINGFGIPLEPLKASLEKDFNIVQPKKINFNFHLPNLFTTSMPTSFPPIIKGARTILLGNSAAISNNYIDAIDLLSTFKLPDDVLIMPQLAYGDTKLIEPVIAYGQKKLGEAFVPQLTLLTEPEHNCLLQGAYCAIMPYINRSQGGLGIKKMLYYGKKIFLSNTNPMFIDYQEQLGTLGELENLTVDALLTPLLSEEMEKQRAFIRRTFDPESIDTEYKQLFG